MGKDLRKPSVEELKGKRDIKGLIERIDFGYSGCTEVCEALGQIGDKRAVAPLIEILERSKDDASKQSAALALGKLRDEEAVGPLSRMLEDESTKAEICYACVAALSDIGSERAVRALFRAQGDMRQKATDTPAAVWIPGNPTVGDLASDELSKLVEPKVETLRKIILDQNEYSEVRTTAFDLLGETYKPALELLGECLVDKDESVREAAKRIAEDLQKLGVSLPQHTVIDPNVALEDQLVHLLDRFLPHKPENSWFRRPNIPPNKLKNAISSYAPEISADEVLALGDATILGSAKKGLLMTRSKLYFNSGATGEVKWSEIQGARPLKGFAEAGLEITFKTGDIVTIACDNFKGVRDSLALFMNQLAAASQYLK
jgi:hypothetical protein